MTRKELLNKQKQTILKIDGQEYPLIWKPKYTSSEEAYYCPELNFYFQRTVIGSYKVYKPHECERECPASPCMIDICYGPPEDDLPEDETIYCYGPEEEKPEEPEEEDHD